MGRGESKHPSLPLARAERKPLDQKKKHPPRYQRENHFWFSFGTQKRTLALMKKRFNPRHQRAENLRIYKKDPQVSPKET